MNIIRRTTAAAVLALMTPFALAVPAHADPDPTLCQGPDADPTACYVPETIPDPATSCQTRVVVDPALVREVDHWRAQAADLQARSTAQSATIDRQRGQIDRLKAKVADLREKLREDR